MSLLMRWHHPRYAYMIRDTLMPFPFTKCSATFLIEQTTGQNFAYSPLLWLYLGLPDRFLIFGLVPNYGPIPEFLKFFSYLGGWAPRPNIKKLSGRPKSIYKRGLHAKFDQFRGSPFKKSGWAFCKRSEPVDESLMCRSTNCDHFYTHCNAFRLTCMQKVHEW